MKYKTVNLDTFSVVGVKEFTSLENGDNFIAIPQVWAHLPEETLAALQKLSNLEPSGVLGLCANMHDGGFDYWIAAATTGECPAGFAKLDIPAAQWAVFEIRGAMPKAIQDGFKQIFNEWLLSSGYQHADAPEIERYSAGDMSSPDYRSEIWIPVVKISEQSMMITVKRTDSGDGDFRRLVELLDIYLDESDKTAHSVCKTFNRIDTIKHAVVAYSTNEAVGCGAIREYSPGTVEIKRMFVSEKARRKGVASQILNELENWARELGFKKCILETGEKLPEAISLYQKKGYSAIAAYGQYECLGGSVCFEKNI
ncbi:MAG: GNAT family N-acetyltransferase [Tannerella sp.]|jgi:predicted transcriptional regulator YdeE/GNAT superfamily N-acetyltransferase|nr:GNAT family N-acetyltransferase [Tannerella sp.]